MKKKTTGKKTATRKPAKKKKKKAGRPKVADPKVSVSFRVSSEVAAFLESYGRDRGSMVDKIVRQSRQYRSS